MLLILRWTEINFKLNSLKHWSCNKSLDKIHFKVNAVDAPDEMSNIGAKNSFTIHLIVLFLYIVHL